MENPSNNLTPRLGRFALAVGILAFVFAIPLLKLLRFAAASELYSYILLIPFISIYLLWLNRANLPLSSPPARPMGAALLVAGAALLAAWWLWLRPGLLNDDYLMIMVFSFLLFFYAICAFSWGLAFLRVAAFPLGFLILLTPLPPSVIQEIDSFLQKGSALAAAGFFSLSGTPFLQDGLTFHLPDITLAIAPECSGIHSTMVLFITALLSAHVFLRTTWKRALLVFFVIPLGMLRNGFRVFVIGEMCVHWGPQMITSPVHRKGGPLFFLLSLVPLFFMLFILIKSEKQRRGQMANVGRQSCAN